jgi:hypothetical protein
MNSILGGGRIFQKCGEKAKKTQRDTRHTRAQQLMMGAEGFCFLLVLFLVVDILFTGRVHLFIPPSSLCSNLPYK